MLSALSTNRNYGSCCDDIRPFIVTVANTESGAISSVAATTGGTIDITEVDELTVTTLIANEITSNSITTFTLNTSIISSFTVSSGDDVTFIGSNSQNFLLWDSSRDTLYIEGDFKTRNCFIYLCNEFEENPLGITDAGKDSGVLFKWYDETPGEEKLGFFGFNDDNERFTFIPNVSVSGESNISAITQAAGDFEAQDMYLRNIINEDVSQNLGITSITDIDIQADNINVISSVDTNIQSTGGDINLTTDSGNLNISVTGDAGIDIQNGVLDILVTGDENDSITIENTQGTIDLLTASTSSQAIYLHTDSGGILLENDSLDKDIILKTTNNIQLSTTGSTVANFSEDGLTVNVAKTDYLQWVPYYKFDAFSGIWLSNRATPSNPIHFWRKDIAAETSRIYADFEVSSRTTTDKGFKLTSIFFAYTVSTASITSITPTITLKSFNPAIPGAAVSLVNVPFTDVNLATGTAIGDHYRSVDVTTPFFLNTEGVINAEIEVVTPGTSIFDFLGVHLQFSQNHL